MPSTREKLMWKKALNKTYADNDQKAIAKYRKLLGQGKESKSMSKKKTVITV